MPAQKSDNPLHAEINKYFNVHVYEHCGYETIATATGTERVAKYIHAGICSANKVATYIENEKIKIKLFNDVLDSGLERYTFKLRDRLKIDFYSK